MEARAGWLGLVHRVDVLVAGPRTLWAWRAELSRQEALAVPGIVEMVLRGRGGAGEQGVAQRAPSLHLGGVSVSVWLPPRWPALSFVQTCECLQEPVHLPLPSQSPAPPAGRGFDENLGSGAELDPTASRCPSGLLPSSSCC